MKKALQKVAMGTISIRKCRKEDKEGIIEVCYHTGYMGEDAQPYFSDKKLFGLLFCSYYPIYEPFNCFVAEISIKNQKKIVGYVLSSLDSKVQEKIYKSRFLWKIIMRLFFVSLWFHLGDFLLVMRYILHRWLLKPASNHNIPIEKGYPAHLHIDVLEPYQHQGIGTKLIRVLESHLRIHHIRGVYLGTSEKNYKAVKFYKKSRYKLLKIQSGLNFWPGSSSVRSYCFGKKIYP